MQTVIYLFVFSLGPNKSPKDIECDSYKYQIALYVLVFIALVLTICLLTKRKYVTTIVVAFNSLIGMIFIYLFIYIRYFPN